MNKTGRESVKPFPIHMNPAALRQAGGAKAGGHACGIKAPPARAMPNGDPPPSMLWGSEKG